MQDGWNHVSDIGTLPSALRGTCTFGVPGARKVDAAAMPAIFSRRPAGVLLGVWPSHKGHDVEPGFNRSVHLSGGEISRKCSLFPVDRGICAGVS